MEQQSSIDDIVIQVLRVVRLLWNRRWLVLGVTALVCAVGWPVVHIIPNKYESSARVYLNTQTILTPLLRGLAVDDGKARDRLASTTRRTLLSRPNLEKIVRETDMNLDIHSPEEMERFLAKLVDRIDVKGSQAENIYRIIYVDKDPELAKRVVELLLSIFVESTLGIARNDTSVTERFIEEQIQEYEARLVAAEERLKDFKRKNMGMMPSEAGDYFRRLQTEITNLETAQFKRREAIKRRDELRKQIQDAASQLQRRALLDEQSHVYDARINAMESRRSELLLQFTEIHPDVVALTESIAALKKKKKLGLESEPGGDVNGVNEFIVPEDMRVALSTTEAEVSGLQVRVEGYLGRVERLENLVDTIPKVEAEFVRLNRDYDINLKNYEELVNRRESAKITREADQSVDDLQFRIIDPPIVPIVPVGPNRPLWLTAVLIVGAGLGGGLAWVLSTLRPTFYEQGELREFSGLPVFGTVSLVVSDREVTKKKLSIVGFMLAGVALFSVYIVQIVLQFVSL